MKHEIKNDILIENGVEGWAVFERRYSRKWIVVARCPNKRCADAIACHMQASIRSLYHEGQPGGLTCVPPCCVNGVCEVCTGAGSIEGGNFCPVALRTYKRSRAAQKRRLAA